LQETLPTGKKESMAPHPLKRAANGCPKWSMIFEQPLVSCNYSPMPQGLEECRVNLLHQVTHIHREPPKPPAAAQTSSRTTPPQQKIIAEADPGKRNDQQHFL
jgi:hypothetical protein